MCCSLPRSLRRCTVSGNKQNIPWLPHTIIRAPFKHRLSGGTVMPKLYHQLVKTTIGVQKKLMHSNFWTLPLSSYSTIIRMSILTLGKWLRSMLFSPHIASRLKLQVSSVLPHVSSQLYWLQHRRARNSPGDALPRPHFQPGESAAHNLLEQADLSWHPPNIYLAPG